MRGAERRPTVVVDLYTRCCLAVIAVLLSVLIVGLWATAPVGVSVGQAAPAPGKAEASGGMGNPIAQRAAMVRALNALNDKLDRLMELLQGGKVKVVVVETEAMHAPAKMPKPPAGR